MSNCSQTGCKVAETGICLENHKAGECPHLMSDAPEGAAAIPADHTTASGQGLTFYSGEKLTPAEVSALLRARPTQVALCVGSQSSGKTTFLARIGEMFRDGSFKRFRFAGSLSLCAFERATWRATIASGAARPDTLRTRLKENDHFLHLSVCPLDPGGPILDLVISDLAGETFSAAVGSLDVCTELSSLLRADHLVAFLDCEKLADRALRHTECDNIKTFLARVGTVRKQDVGGLHVQVIFSRYDCLAAGEGKKDAEHFCKAFEADLRAAFGHKFASLSFHRIAARPETGEPTNEAIQHIVALWLEIPVPVYVAKKHRALSPERDFSGFGLP